LAIIYALNDNCFIGVTGVNDNAEHNEVLFHKCFQNSIVNYEGRTKSFEPNLCTQEID